MVLPDDVRLAGWVAPGWQAVWDAFADNFAPTVATADIGASLAVFRHGKCVVDIWGGYEDAALTRPWRRETLVNVWSATKGVVAIAVAILVDQGRLSYDDLVSHHWPEFGAAGKEQVTVGQVMAHQSGVNGWVEPVSVELLYDWQAATASLARQAPFWPPGTASSYHTLTFGFLAGEIIRRVTGQTPGAFVTDHIARPLGAEFHIGLPEELDYLTADIVPPADGSRRTADGVAARSVDNPQLQGDWPHRRAWRAAEIPAANGQANARGLARIYGALANGGCLEETQILSSAGVDRLREPRSPGPDLLLGPRVWAAGVSLNVMPNWGPLPDTFGHTGWGGAFGCANRQHGIGIGYAMNHMGTELIGSGRGSRLCAAIFDACA